MFDWAKGQKLLGIESRVRDEAFRRYRCSYPTAESYAIAVRMMVEEGRQSLATVQ